MQETMALAEKHAADKAALKVIFGSLVLISKIFYFLNYQDLPEFFEDNMKVKKFKKRGVAESLMQSWSLMKVELFDSCRPHFSSLQEV